MRLENYSNARATTTDHRWPEEFSQVRGIDGSSSASIFGTTEIPFSFDLNLFVNQHVGCDL